MNRQQRRKLDKAMRTAEGKNKVAKQANMMLNMPDMCLTCEKSFDKHSKEMAKTWNVVVTAEEKVRLYCPDCWKMANQLIKEIIDKEQKDESR